MSCENNSIKSKAVVKFSAVKTPATFSKLQCNTDLNMPPANWLSNSANTYGLQHVLCHSTGFSSFRMAHMFPECVGEVDVVSSAENIKHLLKLPHSPKSGISMMVHRIGNTLLIDDFDIHKYLLRKSDDDWKWLRSFIYEHINSLGEKERTSLIKNKTRDVLLKKNLVSKFLYHSISESNDTNKINSGEPSTSVKQHNSPLVLTGPCLPEPNISENVPDPNSRNHTYNRNVVWTFEDIRMLIGTDMPIFGGGKRPCISLRLTDMAQPINVLTGIDYWLDNLMSNVPEVVMCYHLDGIVQKYEIIKTEDLPNIENSKFSPKVIRNVAQNILSFLKANATKAGHTYWLFKGKNDDVVKLYDLTTLCTNNDNCETNNENNKKETNKEQNPFTKSVAMLLYTVARNMKNSTEKITAKQAGSIKTLLDNCIKLLSKEKHPQIITSSYYILSDLYIPACLDPVQPNFEVDDDESDSPENNDEEELYSENIINTNNVAVKIIQETLEEYNLDDNWKHNSSPPPIIGNTFERCLLALNNIGKGLDCLQYFTSTEEQLNKEKDEQAKEEEKQRIIHEEQNQNMAKPFQPIPLPYKPIKTENKKNNSDIAIPLGDQLLSTKIVYDTNLNKTVSNKKKKKLNFSTKSNEEQIEMKSPRSLLLKGESGVIKSWSTHLKILLFEKACLTYTTLAELFYSNENYGGSLKYIYMAMRCQDIVTINLSSISSQKSCLLGRIGDCFFQMAKNIGSINIYLEEFNLNSDVDRIILEELRKDIELLIDYPTPNSNVEELMRISCSYYEDALQYATINSKNELIRRLGSVTNELGVKYMHWAQEEYTKFARVQQEDKTLSTNDDLIIKSKPLYYNLACQSYDCISKGIRLFEEVNDAVNLSFLYSNMGRFMRFRAHVFFPDEQLNNIEIQKKFYNEAFNFYGKALAKLESRKQNVELWDLVNWELSTATFTLAKQLQDNMTQELQYQDDNESEVVDLLHKSLKLCDIDTPGSKQVLYLFRAALIHHRLASFYHHNYQKLHDECRKRTVLQLCRFNYEKSTKILENLLEPKQYLEVQLERVQLQKHLTEIATSSNLKLKNLQIALEILLQSNNIFNHLSTVNYLENPNQNELKNILILFEQQLQYILRSLTKICLTKQNTDSKLTLRYKSMYSITLSRIGNTDVNISDFICELNKIIMKIKNLENL